MDLALYQSKTVEIENIDQFIIGERSDFYTVNAFETKLELKTRYFTGSGSYYGADYQKGIFVETYIKHS